MHFTQVEMPSYMTYGLAVRSAWPLLGLPTANIVPDVIIRRETIGHTPLSTTPSGVAFCGTSQEVCFSYGHLGKVLIREGREIMVDPLSESAEDVLRPVLLGPAMSVALMQRGLLVLHASALLVNGRAVAFIGSSGAGKSTIAAALYAHGHPVVSDDVVAIDDTLMARPAFPRINLWSPARTALDGCFRESSRIHSEIDKYTCTAPNGFSLESHPLARVYVLAEGARFETESLNPPAALRVLLEHAYTRSLWRATRSTSQQFQLCAAIATHASVRVLRVVRSLARLSELSQFVESDLDTCEE